MATAVPQPAAIRVRTKASGLTPLQGLARPVYASHTLGRRGREPRKRVNFCGHEWAQASPRLPSFNLSNPRFLAWCGAEIILNAFRSYTLFLLLFSLGRFFFSGWEISYLQLGRRRL